MNERQFRVLVVDDEEGYREELKLLLQEHHFLVETAVNGEEGLQKLLSDEFDVAVVDLRMPKMDGLEMIRRADAADVDTYAVILTGHGEKADAVAALKLQRTVRDWFEKPIKDPEELVARVASLAEGMSLDEVSRVLSALPPIEV